MKFVGKFLSLFKKDRKKKQADRPAPEVSIPKGVKSILRLPYLAVHPNDLLQSLCMAVVMDTYEPYSASANEIQLYELHEKDDEKSFLGSCWALRIGNEYYANIVGSDAVFAFERGDFLLKRTDRIWVPIEKHNDVAYALICRFEHATANIIPLYFNKVYWREMLNTDVIKSYDGTTSFEEAMKEYVTMLQAISN